MSKKTNIFVFERRKALDGLRGVLAMIVVLFHLKIPFFSQGFIGVDCFFVISGFVITSISIIEVCNTNRIHFTHFYARRIRRLMPASLIVILCSCILYRYMFSDFSIERNRLSFIAASSFWENIYLIENSKNYFGANIDESPLMHYWSLSIEEQFYIIYPSFLLILLKYERRNFVLSKLIFSSIVVLILLYQVYASRFRIYQLLCGCILSLFFVNVDKRKSLHVDVVSKNNLFGDIISSSGFIMLLILSTNILSTSSSIAGFISTILTLIIIIGLELNHDSVLSNILSSSIFQFFGRHSYSIYLWHYPIINIFKRYLHDSTLDYILFLIVIVSFSYLTWIYIELPCKNIDISDKFIVIIGIISIIITCIIVTLILYPLNVNSTPKDNIIINNSVIDVDIDNSYQIEETIIPTTILNFEIAQYVKGYFDEYYYFQDYSFDDICQHPENDVYLLGDSFAQEWHFAIDELRKEENRGPGINLIYQSGTVPLVNTIQYDKTFKSLGVSIDIIELKWEDILRSKREKVVFVSCFSVIEQIFEVDGEYLHPGEERWKEYITEKFIEQYTNVPRTMVVAIIPHYPPPPELFYCSLTNGPTQCPGEYKPQYFEYMDDYIDILNTVQEQYKESFQVISFNDFVCPNDICKAMIDGEVVFRDSLHLQEAFARAKVQELDRKFRPYYKGVSQQNECNF